MAAARTPMPAVVLLSGGLDSAVTLGVARRDGWACHCLSIDYGQRHRCELDAAGRIAAAQGAVDHRVIRVDLRAVGGSALTDRIEVPKDREPDRLSGSIPVTYVPARNLTLLSLALGYAEVVGAADLFIGVNAVDYSGYPDCRPEFIRSFEGTAQLATRAGAEGGVRFHIYAPLAALSKAEIIRLGIEVGVDFALTSSCYDPDSSGRACGRCDSCQIRRRGFTEAGVPDPTAYTELAHA